MKITQPMLYVGLGGTGCLIGTELERRLRDELCGPDGLALTADDQNLRPFQLPSFLQFIYADLNEAEINKARRRVVPTEEHLAAAAFTQHVVSKLVPRRFHSYPEVALSLRTGAPAETKDWLPPQNGEPRVAPMVKGAGQLPTVGRAALFETLRTGQDSVQGPLAAAIAGIAKSGGALSDVGGQARNVLNCDVFIGFSIAGGTGCGIFYDFLHLIGEQFRVNQIHAQIHPLVLMPSAFDEGQGGGRRARLNAATALLDLFRLVDDQNSPDATSLLGDARTAAAVRQNQNSGVDITTYTGGGRRYDSGNERISVHYPELSITLLPATVQTAFLFSRTVAIQRDDLHRSIVSFMLSMIGTELEAPDDQAPTPDQTYQTFAADFVNQGVERQAPAFSGIGRRPVSTSLVASMTVPVDDLADIVSARLLARAVDELVSAPPGGFESNREEIEAFYASCGLEALRVREPARYDEPAPTRGTQAVLQALHTRVNTMESRLPVLSGTLRNTVPRLARDFDYRRGVREGLFRVDPFRLARVVLGDPGSADTADRAGFLGSLESRRKAPPAPAGLSASPPPVEAPRRRFGRSTDWTDPEVRKVLATQNAWYKWRSDSIWNTAWSELSHVWDPTVARLRTEIGGLAGAFLAHAREEPDSFESRTAELYRSRTGVTYLLPPLGDLEMFYRSAVRRFLSRPELGLRPTSTAAEIVNGLLGAGGWQRAYDQISLDSNSERRWDSAVSYVRGILKQEVKGLFVNRGVFGDEQPLLPSLRDLLAKSAGKEGPVVGENDLRVFQRGLAELLPAAYMPEGSGQLKILVAYPQSAKDPVLERYIQDKVNFPAEPDQTVEFRAVDTESVTVVLLRTAMGVADVPELRRILTNWSNALALPQAQDYVAWRQRLGYNFRWLASTSEDRRLIMHHMLCAMWNKRITTDGGRASSPDRIIISLPGEEPVSVVLAVNSYGLASSWADLLRAYEEWVFSSEARDEQIRPEFCERLMRTVPERMLRGPRPSKFYQWFMETLRPRQVEVLTSMLKVAQPGSRSYIRGLLDFWTQTVPEAADLEFVADARSLNDLLAEYRRGIGLDGDDGLDPGPEAEDESDGDGYEEDE